MTTELCVEQRVPADIGRVWRAWTTAEGLAAWWWPHLPDTTYQIDARPGGSYRIGSVAAGIGVRGDYLVLVEPTLIVMSWVWLDAGEPQPGEQVHVELVEVAEDATLVRVRHEVVGGDAARETYRQGWTEVLARLPGTQETGAGGSGPTARTDRE